jgi:hypothetical protein
VVHVTVVTVVFVLVPSAAWVSVVVDVVVHFLSSPIRRDMRSVAGSVLEDKVSSRARDTIVKALNGELRALTELHRMQDLEDVRHRLDVLEEEWG